MLEGVGIGDLHYDKMNKLFPNADTLISQELAKPLDFAVDAGLTHVFLYGDIGEKARLSYEANLAFWDTVFRSEYADLTLDIILGNHDFDEHGRHSLELLEFVCRHFSSEPRVRVHVKPTVMKIEGVQVQFLPYPYTKTRADCLNVGHFESAGSTRDNGMLQAEGVEPKHLTLLGHLHTPHSVNKHYYSGTLYQTNFGESQRKGFHHFRVNPDMTHKVKLIPNDPAFKLFNLEIWDPKDLRQVSDNPLYLYKVYVQEGVKLADDELAKYLNIVKIKFFKSKRELKSLLEDEWRMTESATNIYQPKTDLKNFLRERKVDSSMRRQVMELHTRLIESNMRKANG